MQQNFTSLFSKELKMILLNSSLDIEYLSLSEAEDYLNKYKLSRENYNINNYSVFSEDYVEEKDEFRLRDLLLSHVVINLLDIKEQPSEIFNYNKNFVKDLILKLNLFDNINQNSFIDYVKDKEKSRQFEKMKNECVVDDIDIKRNYLINLLNNSIFNKNSQFAKIVYNLQDFFGDGANGLGLGYQNLYEELLKEQEKPFLEQKYYISEFQSSLFNDFENMVAIIDYFIRFKD